MTADTFRKGPEWSRNRWLGTIMILVLIQAGMVVFLTHWPMLPSPSVTPVVRFRMVTGSTYRRADDDPFLSDPLLFAGEDSRGFSGAALRSLPRSDYEVADLREAPQWLALEGKWARAGGLPTIPVPENHHWSVVSSALLGESPPPLRLGKESRVSLHGSLAGRVLLEPGKLTSWKVADILDVTVVEVGVTRAGDVLIARLVSSCGLAAADDAGLAWARQVRLVAVSDEARDPGLIAADLAWGELVFHWHTEPAN